MEKKLQTKAIKWLKDHGAYVIKTRPGAGTPVGCPDVIALFRDRWAALEFKASEKALFQTGQIATIGFLGRKNKHVYVAYPENWEKIKLELSSHFFQSDYGR